MQHTFKGKWAQGPHTAEVPQRESDSPQEASRQTSQENTGKRNPDAIDVFISLDGYSACLYRAVPAKWCLVVDF